VHARDPQHAVRIVYVERNTMIRKTPGLLAAALLLAAAAAHSQPIDECRATNESLRNELTAMHAKARDNYTLVGTNRERFEAEMTRLHPLRGTSTTLADCRNKTASYQALKDMFPALLSQPSPEVVACRNRNRQMLEAITVGIKSFPYPVSIANTQMLGNHINGITAANLAAEKRGYTVQDCHAVGGRIVSYWFDMQKICHRLVGQGGRLEVICMRVKAP
jgi:hypothetical protein